MGPQNVMKGDRDLSTVDIPETKIPEEVLQEERKMAKYSRTAEYKRFAEFMEDRIKFYQSFLPNGTPLRDADPKVDLGQQWRVANTVIAEFRGVLNAYQQSKEIVEDAER